LKKGVAIDEESIRVFDYEPLIGYDLQLKLLDYISGGHADIDIANTRALELFIKNLSFEGLRFVNIGNARDVRNGFTLDKSQTKAVEAALALDKNELLLIVGPPGTGKTRVIAKIAYELSSKGEKVLIASHTNRAVDNAIELLPVNMTLRVGRPEKVLDTVQPYLLGPRARQEAGEKLLSIENEIMKMIASLREYRDDLNRSRNDFEKEKYREIIKKVKDGLRDLYVERGELIKDFSESLIDNVKIIGSTLIKSQLPPLIGVYFDTVIIDEASQASLLLALLSMVKGFKWVIVGDHKQLLPIFKSVNNASIQEDLSTFVYLRNKYPYRSLWLENHYRSNYLIIDFVARNVYEGKIHPVDECKNRMLKLMKKPRYEFLDADKPVVFVHVDGEEAFESRSRYNIKEIDVVREAVKELINCGVSRDNIGVISPYRAQRNRIANEFNRVGIEHVEIGTVDAFQGREKDVIMLSVTATSKSGLKFASDEHRLNVAFTRPRYKLIVVGNGKSIYRYAKNTLLYKFLEYVYRLKSIWDYKEGKWLT